MFYQDAILFTTGLNETSEQVINKELSVICCVVQSFGSFIQF
jgi:hypothetical protein